MDLVTGAKRVIIAIQHTAKGKPKVLNKCTLTSARAVDLVVIEMAVIGFPGGRATLIETGAVVSVEQVVAPRLRRSWCCPRRFRRCRFEAAA
jgi:acetate CoA/acetoacetate CoA-transferase beta subunit